MKEVPGQEQLGCFLEHQEGQLAGEKQVGGIQLRVQDSADGVNPWGLSEGPLATSGTWSFYFTTGTPSLISSWGTVRFDFQSESNTQAAI